MYLGSRQRLSSGVNFVYQTIKWVGDTWNPTNKAECLGGTESRRNWWGLGELTSKLKNTASFQVVGSTLSSNSMPLAHLEIILPEGVTSKNWSLALIIPRRKAWWSLTAAIRHANLGVILPMHAKMPESNKNPLPLKLMDRFHFYGAINPEFISGEWNPCQTCISAGWVDCGDLVVGPMNYWESLMKTCTQSDNEQRWDEHVKPKTDIKHVKVESSRSHSGQMETSLPSNHDPKIAPPPNSSLDASSFISANCINSWVNLWSGAL